MEPEPVSGVKTDPLKACQLWHWYQPEPAVNKRFGYRATFHGTDHSQIVAKKTVKNCRSLVLVRREEKKALEIGGSNSLENLRAAAR